MARTLMPAPPSAPNSLPETPGMPAMPSPTTANMARSGVDVDTLDLPIGELTRECRAQHRLGAHRLRLRNGAADRMLGAALRDQDDRDALFAQRAEQPMRGARHADHAGAFEVDERHVLDAGDALDRQREVGCEQIRVPGV